MHRDVIDTASPKEVPELAETIPGYEQDGLPNVSHSVAFHEAGIPV